MKRILKTALLALLFTQTQAATMIVTGACSKKPLFKQSVKIAAMSAGDFSVKVFDQYKIPYDGSTNHMSSIFNSATGLDAMEVLSDTEMRSHGWCFSINGVLADVYPHEVQIKDSDVVHWFYGYAYYNAGEWTGMCAPTFEIAPDQFCE
ncbi:DUF4430 domain-containing protein [Bacteriovorax sp. DB6_IX]|uniref:DUF4430 domain-containing protein n=1 Tax=Bacteriovorax sp. DB6_IX TaxID=1353530 RepID=UPI000389E9E7|nr:DUF4430 domain-containing protein [Bacteriovorax sp. DB6_IX]EQC51739.1 putative lipoprotein [Bacteriovorax sp. DB6_IX]